MPTRDEDAVFVEASARLHFGVLDLARHAGALVRRDWRVDCDAYAASFLRPALTILLRAGRMPNEPVNSRACSSRTTISVVALRSTSTTRCRPMPASGQGRNWRSLWPGRSPSSTVWRAMRAHSRALWDAASDPRSGPGPSRTAALSSRADAGRIATNVVRSLRVCRFLRHGDASSRYLKGRRASAAQGRLRRLPGCPRRRSATSNESRMSFSWRCCRHWLMPTSRVSGVR